MGKKAESQNVAKAAQEEVAATSGDGSTVAQDAAVSAPEFTVVQMEDGREMKFSGKRKMLKEVLVDESGVTVRLNFINGSVRSFRAGPDHPLALRLMGHGASQKIGDDVDVKDSVDDMILSCENMIKRLDAGDWGAPRTAGDSFAGASIVVKAIAKVKDKSVEEVKLFLETLLKAKPELTRRAMYKTFRNPETPIGQEILRLEAEGAKKETPSGPSADELLEGI